MKMFYLFRSTLSTLDCILENHVVDPDSDDHLITIADHDEINGGETVLSFGEAGNGGKSKPVPSAVEEQQGDIIQLS